MSDDSTRAALTAAWNAAKREAERSGGLLINHAATAGWLLERAEGDASRALEAATVEWHRWPWLARAADYLALVLVEEQTPRAKKLTRIVGGK
jgi:hypothetical protein